MGPGLCEQRGARLRMDALQPRPAGSIASVPNQTQNQNQNQNQNQTQSPGLAARQRRRLGWGGCLNLRWSVIRKLFPTWARIPTKHDSPNHRGTHLGNPDPRTMTGLSHAAQTITANCAHGGCQSCLLSATIKENCGTNHVLPRLRLPSLASAGHRCGENRRRTGMTVM